MNLSKLFAAYYAEKPDVSEEEQKVSFGTSGHRGSPLKTSFNEWHLLAIVQAICDYRQKEQIQGPLFIGIDTHAISEAALMTAIEVLAANGITFMLSENDEYVPTPAISLAILNYNKSRPSHLADGIVITPSHNPPEQGGIKYNSLRGGPAELQITKWIEERANVLLKNQIKDVKRIPYKQALQTSFAKRHNYLQEYIQNLAEVIDMNVIRHSNIQVGVDPLGGAGVHYWKAIAEHYQIPLTVLNETIDPSFSFMHPDWDGQIRMDPSSPDAMKYLIDSKGQFDVTVACDTDHDRHGIITKEKGLLPSNHYLAASVDYLLQFRPLWIQDSAIGKTFVTTRLIDKIAAKRQRKTYETPVGFKWFVDGLFQGPLRFGGEESAGASFSRFDGSPWTTDKDGIIMALLAAEMTAKTGLNPGQYYDRLTAEYGNFFYRRIETKATLEQRKALKNLSVEEIHFPSLAGDPIETITAKAKGNQAPLDGILVETKNGWFAVRPSGTEEICKIYGESFVGQKHLDMILQEAETIIQKVIKPVA